MLPYIFNAKLLCFVSPVQKLCGGKRSNQKKVLLLTVKKVVLMIVPQNDLFGGLLLVLN